MSSNLGDPSSAGISKSLYRKLSPLQRSLCFLLESLRGKAVTVELKNDTVVKGIIEEADQQMNLTLFNATQTRRGSLKNEVLEVVFIQGITIRYVHLPDDLDPFQATEQHVRSSKHSTNISRPQTLIILHILLLCSLWPLSRSYPAPLLL